MGRKRIKPETTKDRIGEPVDLEKCPECREHPDCFSCIEGRCTALNECEGEGCVFYCSQEKAIRQTKEAYRRLKEKGRYDLIRKYLKPLTALGVLDDEFDEFERTSRELESFRDADFEALMKEVPGFSA